MLLEGISDNALCGRGSASLREILCDAIIEITVRLDNWRLSEGVAEIEKSVP